MERLKRCLKNFDILRRENYECLRIKQKSTYRVETKLFMRSTKNVSYGELCDADNIISDEEIFQTYSCTDFSSEDFMCA